MGLKLLFFTGFSKFVAHESVAFMLYYLVVIHVVCLSFFGGVFGVGWEFFQLLSALWLLCIRFLVCFQSVSNSLYSALCCLNPS